jgi:cytochrome c
MVDIIGDGHPKNPWGLYMIKPALAVVFLLAASAAQADEPVGFQRGMSLVTKYHCQSCHAVDKTLAGPSFRDIAKHYASDPNARGEVSTNILNGSTGAWGPTPMPPVPVSQTDLRPLVDFILSLTTPN